MSQPYLKSHADLPVHMRGILVSWGITPDPAGAGLLAEIAEEADGREQLINGIMKRYPEGLQGSTLKSLALQKTIVWNLERLANAAMRSHKLDDMEDHQKALYVENMKPPPIVLTTIPKHFLDKWRKVTQGRMSALEPTTMRELDLKLKEIGGQQGWPT